MYGLYLITYKNGMQQKKVLIPHELYEWSKHENPEVRKLIRLPEHYFTDKSPLFKAIETGVLSLPKNQGGKHPTTVKKIL